MTVTYAEEKTMNITKNDAEAALRDVGETGEYSQTLFHYQITSPYLLLWGVLWIIAGIVSVISPQNTGIGWLVVVTIGIIANGYLVASDARRFAESNIRRESLRYVAAVAVLTGFLTMTFVVFAPVSAVEIQTFITILIASIYMILGFWTGKLLSVVGADLAILVVIAYFFLPAYYPLIVSILGGAALIAGGLLMRKAEKVI